MLVYIHNEITGEDEYAIQVKMESAKAPGTWYVMGYLSRYISGNSGRTLNYVGQSVMVSELLQNSSHLAKRRMNI